MTTLSQGIWNEFFWDGPKLNQAFICACIAPTCKSSAIRSFDPLFGIDGVIVNLQGLIEITPELNPKPQEPLT